MFTIADNRADFDVMLKTLSGTHTRSRRESFPLIYCGILGIGMAVFIAALFVRDPTLTDVELWICAAIVLSGLYTAALAFTEIPSVYVIDGSGIERRNPLPFLRWRIDVPELYVVELEIGSVPALKIRTADGRKRRLPLFGHTLEAMTKLYPELFGPSPPLQFGSSRRWLIVALAVAVLATAAIVIYTINV